MEGELIRSPTLIQTQLSWKKNTKNKAKNGRTTVFIYAAWACFHYALSSNVQSSFELRVEFLVNLAFKVLNDWSWVSNYEAPLYIWYSSFIKSDQNAR